MQKESKKYNLHDRTLTFAGRIRKFLRGLNSFPIAVEDKRQLIRSSGSVGANYIEANQSISPKDFVLRMRISKKEAAESGYWLSLIQFDLSGENKKEALFLIDEATQLQKIFGAILNKYK